MRSIRNKLDELVIFIKENEMNINAIAVSEHWLEKDEDIHIDGYELASCFSRTSKKGGGSCIFLQMGVECKEFKELKDKSIESVIECSAIILAKLKIIIINIYRPPQGDIEIFFVQFEAILQQLNSKYTILFSGDFNIDLLNDNRITNRLRDTFKSYNLLPVIQEPTRITETSQTLVDNIFINIEDYQAKVLLSMLSDHTAQRVSFVSGEEENYRTTLTIERRIFSIHTLQLLKCELESEDWQQVFLAGSVDDGYEHFVQIVIETINKHVRKRRFNLGDSFEKEWLTDHIRMQTRIKRQLYEGMINNRISQQQYNSFCENLKKEIENSKKRIYSEHILRSKNVVRGTWDVINHIQGKKSKSRFDLKLFESRKMDSHELLSEINDYFINATDVGRRRNVQKSKAVKTVEQTFSLYLTDDREVIATINSLNDTSSMGYDEIPTSFLKCCAESLAHPLAHIINKSFLTGSFPEALKYTLVKPIYKNGEKDDIKNYRPIALISNISKIFEKIIAKRIMDFANKYDIFSQYQNGYIKGRSTDRAMFQLLCEIVNVFNQREPAVCVLMDLTKAFDCVHYPLLLEKLEVMGFRGVALDWVQSYLTRRYQSVVATNDHGQEIRSEWKEILRGVPQGSVLGPILFLLYVNDLPSVTENMTLMFADDTSAVVRGKAGEDLNTILENMLASYEKWFVNNNLNLNINKTKLLKFNTNDDINITIENKTLTCSSEAKFLGWMLDARLSWKSHIETLACKLCSQCYALKTIAKSVSVILCGRVLQTKVWCDFLEEFG